MNKKFKTILPIIGGLLVIILVIAFLSHFAGGKQTAKKDTKLQSAYEQLNTDYTNLLESNA